MRLFCWLLGHRWNIMFVGGDNRARPSAPTSCLRCRARYTVEDEARSLIDQEGKANEKE